MKTPPRGTRQSGHVRRMLRNPLLAVSLFVLLPLGSIVTAGHRLGLFTNTGELGILLVAGSAYAIAVFWWTDRFERVRDLNREKEEAIRASEERYRLLFERNLAGIYRTTVDGIILDCNDAYVKILGYTDRSELLSGSARDHYFVESEREAFISDLGKTQKVTNLEVCLKRRDGLPVWVLESTSLVEGPTGPFLEGSLIDVSDRKQVEEALRQSEERYRFLFDVNPLPMWVYEIESLRFLDVNEAALRHYGYARAEFLSMHLPDIWPPEDRDGGGHPIAKSAKKPQPFTASRHLLKNGTIAFVEVSAVDLPGGPVRRRMALARDVTEQKAAERALVESEGKYRHIFNLAPVGIYQTTLDGKILTANPAFARILGYDSAEELIENHTAQDLFFQREERDGAVREFIEKYESKKSAERLLKGKAGNGVWVQITTQLTRNEAGEIQYLEGFVFDITERKLADEQQARLQEAVLESARQWRDTFDAIDMPVFVVDGQAIVKRLNHAAVELAGQSYVDVLGKRLDELGSGELWTTSAGLVRSAAKSSPRSGVLCRDEEGRKVWEISAIGFEGFESQETRLSIVIARDITAIVRLQESVLRAESMSSMGSLVAGVAHEVRNPLFAISATLDAFDARFRDRDDYKKYARAFRTQLDRMSNLMRDLLDYGRPAVLELREVPPGELVRDAVRGCSDLASRNQVPVEIEAPEDLPAIRVDRGRTVQVFVNLVENAIQHSPENAPVVVRAEAVARAGSRGVRFTVEDSGPGFQPADIPKLFDPFFTKRQGGTGLGLAIVRKIVEEHGGTISPANRNNGGAVVSVWLPCELPDAGESERKA